MMMMKSVFWWRKPEYPEETTGLQQVTDETFQLMWECTADSDAISNLLSEALLHFYLSRPMHAYIICMTDTVASVGLL